MDLGSQESVQKQQQKVKVPTASKPDVKQDSSRPDKDTKPDDICQPPIDVDKVFEKMGVPSSKGKDEETKAAAKNIKKVEIEKPKTVLCTNEVNQEDEDWSEVTGAKSKDKYDKSITNDAYTMPPKRQAAKSKLI